MNFVNAVKLLATSIDYNLTDSVAGVTGKGGEDIKDAIEEASLVVQKALDFDTNKVKVDLLAGKLKKYKKPVKEVNVKMRGI